MVLDAWSHRPRSLVLASAIADQHIARGALASARDLLEDIRRRRPDFDFLVEQQARLALAGGRPSEALRLYLEAIERPEADITTFRTCAEMLASAGRTDEAIRVLSRGLRNPIGDYRDWARAHELRGTLLARSGKLPQGIRDLRSACRIAPRLGGAWDDLGRALLAAGDPARARDALARALTLKPGDRQILATLATLERDLGDFPSAAEHYRALIALDPDTVALRNNLGACLIAIGDRAAAREVFEEVLRRSPDDRYALATLGSLDAAAGDRQSARRRYERFLSLLQAGQPDDDLTRQVRKRLEALGAL